MKPRRLAFHTALTSSPSSGSLNQTLTLHFSPWILGLAFLGLSHLAQAQDVTSGLNLYSVDWAGGTIASGATLQLDNGATVSGNATNNGTLQYNASENLTISNTVAGTGTLSLTGSGTLTLTRANTYTGLTTVSTGVLNIQNANALGTTAAGTSVTSGAALQIQGGITTLAEALTLRGTGVSASGALRNISDNNTYAGLVTLGAATRINSDAGTLTLSNTGIITGATFGLTVGGAGNTSIASIIGTTSGTLTKDGSGTLTLTGANTYTGGTTISAGTLSVGSGGTGGSIAGDVTNNATLAFSRSDAMTYAGIVSGTGQVTKSGSGTLTLSGANTYSGGTVLSGGTLTAGHQNAFGTGALTIGASTVLDLANYNIGNTLTNNGGTILNAGTLLGGNFNGGTTDLSGTNSTVTEVTGTATVNVTGADATITTVSGGTLNVNAAGTTIQSYNGGNVAVGAARTVTIHEGTSSGSLSGEGGLAKAGTGTLTLTGTNTYSGATTVTAGLLTVNGDNSSSATTVGAGATLGGSGTIGALVVQNGATIAPGNSPGTLAVDGNVTWQGGGNYNWQLVNALGSAGTGWDTLAINGELNLGALSSANPFNLNLWSLSSAEATAGDVQNFASSGNFSWTIATATGGIRDFNAGNFRIHTAATNGTNGFTNDLTGGAFSLAVVDGNQLNLVYQQTSAVPEPTGHLALLALLSGGLLTRRRKV
jgi:autotransporter-associated beta strand protein